jgi:hypothetical protein
LSFRGSVLEEFAGDLEYHPRRGALYLILAAGVFSFWYFTPPDRKFTPTPIVFALGAITLLLKGVFLLRKSSEGVGMTQSDFDALQSAKKTFPSIPEQTAQLLQDFGAGSMLLWPLLNSAKDIDASWTDPPLLCVFISGAILFATGWLTCRMARNNKTRSSAQRMPGLFNINPDERHSNSKGRSFPILQHWYN